MAAISSEKQRSVRKTMKSATTTNPSHLTSTMENDVDDVEMGESTLSPDTEPTKPRRRKTSRSIVDDHTFVIDGTAEILPSCSLAQPNETKTEAEIISSSSSSSPDEATMTARRRAIDELAVENIELSRLMDSVFVSLRFRFGSFCFS